MRFYRTLLRLYPSSFRSEYGREMEAIFAGRLARSGAAGAWGLWISAFFDVLGNAARAHVDILRQDTVYACRTMRRSPGFAVTALLVTALGIGAATSTFSILDRVLLRPLPFPEPDRLVALWQDEASKGSYGLEASPANYRDWKRLSRTLEGMAGYHTFSFNVLGEGAPERVNGSVVTSGFFPTLRAKPAIGRTFSAEDDRPGAPGTVVLSHRLWTTIFRADPGAPGRKVILDDIPYVVIGVMPENFLFPNGSADLWTPHRLGEKDFAERGDYFLLVIARMRPGVSLPKARAEMNHIAAQLKRAYPKENAHVGATVNRLSEQSSRQSRVVVEALFGAALAVLLIACANLANLLLARALGRRRELAVRTAMGAGRERLVRQLLTESLILAACGGALGVGIAAAAGPLLARVLPASVALREAPLDLGMLAFAALLTAITGVGFGVVPALRGSEEAEESGLREGSRVGAGRRTERLRSILVVAEVTASVALLISSGLLIRALWRVQQTPPGFRAEGVLTLRTALPMPRYEKTNTRLLFYERVVSEVTALPGVSRAAYVTGLPMVMRGGIWGATVEGEPREGAEPHPVSIRFATPGFFETMGVPVRAGRDVALSDTRSSPPVAVVSESFVSKYLPPGDAIGRRFFCGDEMRTIAGVVGDVRVRGLERVSEPQVYFPAAQAVDGQSVWYAPKDLVIRSSVAAGTLLPSLRNIISKADPQLPVSDVRSLTDIVQAETGPRTVQVRILGAFAAISFLLAGIGIHGLLAFAVSHRTREIGVRIALGARPRDILEMVLRRSALLAGIGIAAGVVLAWVSGRLMEALLAGVSAHDAATFA
ncbi:MAG: ABC transporter permease, partial [Acidobacteriota bacterium]